MEVEITEIPPLGPGEQTLVDLHSVLNILNVLQGECQLIGLRLANNPELLARSLSLCGELTRNLTNPGLGLHFAATLTETEHLILDEVTAASAQYPFGADAPDHHESVDNILSVFRILETRARELLALAGEPDRWIQFPLDELRADFLAVFSAIEKNSKGRYRIIYNVARQQPTDYYINFVFESEDAHRITLPLVFKDVMRDLIANARKYTAPGGTISIGLHETADRLRFVVQDTGCGIPADEIKDVVQFGRRGSNVQHLRTMGGGFGLTKACLTTRRFGGRMWIKSELGRGTRITLVLPRPVQPWAPAR